MRCWSNYLALARRQSTESVVPTRCGPSSTFTQVDARDMNLRFPLTSISSIQNCARRVIYRGNFPRNLIRLRVQHPP